MERVVSDREQELQQIHNVQKQSGVRAPLSSISNVAPGVPSAGKGKKVLHWEDIEERATVARQHKQQTIERYKSVLSRCHTLDERKASEVSALLAEYRQQRARSSQIMLKVWPSELLPTANAVSSGLEKG